MKIVLALAILLISLMAPLAVADATNGLPGTWNIVVTMEQENHDAKLVFRSENGTLTGKVRGGEENREFELKSLKVEGDTVTFGVNTGDHTAKFTLKISGDKLEGNVKVEEQTGSIKGSKEK